MELFADEYYNLDSTNKLNYYDIFFSTTEVLNGYTLSSEPTSKFKNGNVLIIVDDDIDSITLRKDNNLFAYGVKIATKVKKFVLE